MDQPGDAVLRSAGLLDLGRSPATAPARQLVEDVWERIRSHMAKPSRPAGKATIIRDKANVGVVLGGIMRPGIRDGEPVSVQAGKAGVMWEAPVIGYHRVWNIIEALKAVGLVCVREGVRSQKDPFTGGFIQEGLPARVWPSAVLLDMAAAKGLTVETRKTDWLADASIVAKPVGKSERRTIKCPPLRDGQQVVPLAPDVTNDTIAEMQGPLQAINDLLATTVITGAGSVIGLRRCFRHSLRLHGRHYTGHGTLQQFSEAERARITFNGEPTAEVDVRASQITVALGLANHCLLPDGQLPRTDLYAVSGLPRDIVKAWMVRTMGHGHATWTGWGKKPPLGAEQYKPREVWEAVRPLYPFLADLSAFVPDDLLASLPETEHHWAGGQFVAAREASMIGAAMAYCVQQGVPVLPVHDSLIVPLSKIDVAREGLQGAFMALGGVMPHLTVSLPQDAG